MCLCVWGGGGVLHWWIQYQLAEVYSQIRYQYDAVLSITAIQMVTTSSNLDTQAHVLHMTVTWALIWERTDTWKVTDIGQDLDSSLDSVHSVVRDHLDRRTVCAHWMSQNLTDSYTELAVEENIFGSALLQGMRRGLITWHPKPKKHEGLGNTHVPPQSNIIHNNAISWNYGNCLLEPYDCVSYGFPWHLLPICHVYFKVKTKFLASGYLLPCFLKYNLSELSNVLLQYWKLSKLYTATAE
jgi:hypothetical protein